MELFFVLLGLFLLITFFMPWVNRASISNLRHEVDDLRNQIALLRDGKEPEIEPSKVTYEGGASLPTSAPEPEVEKDNPFAAAQEAAARFTARQKVAANEFAQPSVVYKEVKEEPKKERVSFEHNFGTKITVWIGAVALAFAGFYLIKYSLDNNWISPAVRLMLGGAFGAALIALGQFLSMRPSLARNERIAQGLVGAGIVTLYGCIYAALNVYEFLEPIVAFVGMAAVTVVAVVMSLRHGAPIALFGIVGGMLTPFLVGSDQPNAPLLFAYLFIFYGGILTVLRKREWWGLALVALFGAIAWPFIFLVSAFSGGEETILLLYVLAICFVSLLAGIGRVQERRETPTMLHGFNALSVIGACWIVLNLSFRVELGLFEWASMSLFTLAAIVLSYFREQPYRNLVWAKLALDLYLFAVWVNGINDVNTILMVIGFLTVPYVVIPLWLMRKVSDPRHWAVMQVAFSIGMFLITYFQLDHLFVTEGLSVWSFAALILASLSIYMASDISHSYKADDKICDFMVSVYSLSASSFLALGITIALPYEYLPFAFAAQALATLLIYEATKVDFLKAINLILTVIFIGLNYEYLVAFGAKMILSLVDEQPSIQAETNPVLELGIPALFFIAASWFWGKIRATSELPVEKTLYSTAIALVLACAYIALRYSFHPGENIINIEAGFIERNVVTLLFVVMALASYFIMRLKPEWQMRDALRLLSMIAVLRVAYFDLFLMNPYFSSQNVGELPILNGVTLAYGMGIAFTIFMLRTQSYGIGMTKFLQILSLIFLFALVTLNVRQMFHGGGLHEGLGIEDMELYMYSIAWLLTGIGLVAYGIVRESKTARTASLVFMLLAVAKVFFVDAAELEGLYRVFSFLGLGVSLIGLSFFYSRYVFKAKAQ